MKKLKTSALAAIIVFFLAACGSSAKRAPGTFLDGSWFNTGENDNCRILFDANTWTYYIDNIPTYKGTWVCSVTPAPDVYGTLTFTMTHVELKKGWVDLSAEHKNIKSCTVNFYVDPFGKQLFLNFKQLAADDPTGLWSKLEGVYVKGRSDGKGGWINDSNAGAAGDQYSGDSDSASQTEKSAPKTNLAARPYISYVITGGGTTFTAVKNGTTLLSINQPINDVINAIRTDSKGSNAAIRFGNGISIMDIGAASLNFDSVTDSIIALSGKITSSAPPVIVVNSVTVTSTADISTSFMAAGDGSVIDNNNGTLIINGGTVAAHAPNIHGIRNTGGTVIISNGNITPRGEGIQNDSGSGKVGNVIIYGGTVHSLSNRGISNMKDCTLTINGGTVSSSTSESIYNPGGTIKLSGGSVSGGNSGHAILNTDGGKVTITGGTVSLVNISGRYAAISNNDGCTVTISGGSIVAPGGGTAISNTDGAVANITSPPAVIIGNSVKK